MQNSAFPEYAQPNQPVTAATMNSLLRGVLARIKGGAGIRVQHTGETIILTATGAAQGAGMYIPWVPALPPIPTTPQTTQMVYWATSVEMDGGTGDGQVWMTTTGETKWRPLMRLTSSSGTP